MIELAATIFAVWAGISFIRGIAAWHNSPERQERRAFDRAWYALEKYRKENPS